MLRTLLFILLIILLIGALPTWPCSTGWAYYPSSGAGLLLVILLALIVVGAVAPRCGEWAATKSSPFLC